MKQFTPMTSRPSFRKKILHGHDEKIFRSLPERVLSNLSHPASENALVWNLVYPLTQPTVAFQDLVSLPPLWGSHLVVQPDQLKPYFWGYDLEGDPLPGLQEVLLRIDGPGVQTEVDLFLVGEQNLICVEAKNLASPGRCSRYQAGRCPEVHVDDSFNPGCRYWEIPQAAFSTALELGDRPRLGDQDPHCNQHYQLARTLVIGLRLAETLRRELHLWMLLPRSRWRVQERGWLAFSEKVRDEALWRKLRVLAWEELQSLHTPG